MLTFTKEKVTQKQCLRMTHTYVLIEPKFQRKRENKEKEMIIKQIVSLMRRLFCVSSSLLFISW